MLLSAEDSIANAEERLRLAMIASDASELDELISPELVFTTHLGQVLGKQGDLELHKSGAIRLRRMIPSERQIQIHGECAIVSVRMAVEGAFGGTPFAETFRYTRMWRQDESKGWQVVAGHMSVIHGAENGVV